MARTGQRRTDDFKNGYKHGIETVAKSFEMQAAALEALQKTSPMPPPTNRIIDLRQTAASVRQLSVAFDD